MNGFVTSPEAALMMARQISGDRIQRAEQHTQARAFRANRRKSRRQLWHH